MAYFCFGGPRMSEHPGLKFVNFILDAPSSVFHNLYGLHFT